MVNATVCIAFVAGVCEGNMCTSGKAIDVKPAVMFWHAPPFTMAAAQAITHEADRSRTKIRPTTQDGPPNPSGQSSPHAPHCRGCVCFVAPFVVKPAGQGTHARCLRNPGLHHQQQQQEQEQQHRCGCHFRKPRHHHQPKLSTRLDANQLLRQHLLAKTYASVTTQTSRHSNSTGLC